MTRHREVRRGPAIATGEAGGRSTRTDPEVPVQKDEPEERRLENCPIQVTATFLGVRGGGETTARREVTGEQKPGEGVDSNERNREKGTEMRLRIEALDGEGRTVSTVEAELEDLAMCEVWMAASEISTGDLKTEEARKLFKGLAEMTADGFMGGGSMGR